MGRSAGSSSRASATRRAVDVRRVRRHVGVSRGASPPGPMRRRSRLFLPGGGRDTSTMGGRSRRLIHGTRHLAPRGGGRIFDRAAPIAAARGADDRTRERRQSAVESRERATSRFHADVGGVESTEARGSGRRRGGVGGDSVVLRRPRGGPVVPRHPCVCSVVCRDTSPTCEYTQAKFRGEAKPPRRFLGANGPRPFVPDGPWGRADKSANPGVAT